MNGIQWIFTLINLIWTDLFGIEIPIGQFNLKLQYLWLACFFISFIMFPLIRFIFGEGTTSAIKYDMKRGK